MQIFQLTWGTYDCVTHYYFEAPNSETTHGDFKTLCDRLMKEAAEDIIAGKEPEHRFHKSKQWLGYSFLVDEVSARLLKYGYKKVVFEEVAYTHGMIINVPKDDTDKVLGRKLIRKVIDYNKAFRKEMDVARIKWKDNEKTSKS
jgi:hypothetical protein